MIKMTIFNQGPKLFHYHHLALESLSPTQMLPQSLQPRQLPPPINIVLAPTHHNPLLKNQFLEIKNLDENLYL